MVGRVRAPPVGRGYQVRRRTGGGRGYPFRVSRRRSRTRSAAPRAAIVAVAIAVLAVVIGACSVTPAASFDPTAACTGDGRAAGAYPDLEARIPTSYQGRGPDTLDSGRNCSQENLGVLTSAGIDEVRFAGGTWDFGGERAAALVVFQAPDLTADDVAAFYAASARAANRTTVTGESTPTLAGRPGHRLDTMTGERVQTVVSWPAAEPGVVNVVITNDLPDPKIDAAVEAFGGR
jgi:hypothetical protein